MISAPQPRRARTLPAAVAALRRVAAVPWRLLRQQVAREDHAHLMAQFTLLDNPSRPARRVVVWGRPDAGPPYADPADPLERLWSLPAAASGG